MDEEHRRRDKQSTRERLPLKLGTNGDVWGGSQPQPPLPGWRPVVLRAEEGLRGARKV